MCATDMLNKGLTQRNFLKAQGYEVGPVILHQDNMSTIKMITNGKSTSQRTRHINVRYFFLREMRAAMIDIGEMRVVYTSVQQFFDPDRKYSYLTKTLCVQL